MEKQTGYQVLTPPKIKQRIRKAKGTPGITIETVHNAYIDITIPERPKDVNSVTFRLHIQDEIFNINWPISQSAYEALRVFFTSQKGMEGRNEI